MNATTPTTAAAATAVRTIGTILLDRFPPLPSSKSTDKSLTSVAGGGVTDPHAVACRHLAIAARPAPVPVPGPIPTSVVLPWFGPVKLPLAASRSASGLVTPVTPVVLVGTLMPDTLLTGVNPVVCEISGGDGARHHDATRRAVVRQLERVLQRLLSFFVPVDEQAPDECADFFVGAHANRLGQRLIERLQKVARGRVAIVRDLGERAHHDTFERLRVARDLRRGGSTGSSEQML